MKNNFDKTIKQKLNKVEIAPSNALWDKIEKELDKNENSIKPIIIPFWHSTIFKRGIAASIIFLLGGFSTYLYLNNNNTITGINTIASTTTETKETNSNNNTLNNTAKNTKTNIQKQKSNTNFNSKTTDNNTLASNTKNGNSTGSKNHSIANKVVNLFSLISNNNNNTFNISKSTNSKWQASDYIWTYNEETKAYNVVPKSDFVNSDLENSNNSNFNIINEEIKDNSTSFMSLENKEENKEEKIETLEITKEDDSYKQFKTKVSKLNYKGFWLGPNVGYESVFVGKSHYAGGSFGIDLGYDFGGSIGIQSGLRYAINSKTIKIQNTEGNYENYKSEFNSLHIPLMLRYKFTKLTKSYSKPLSFNILGGMDYAYINTKNINQLGLVLGTEYDLFTQADLMFTLGLRGGVYNNLNYKNINIQEQITRYNYNLNAYISIRFIDWIKKN